MPAINPATYVAAPGVDYAARDDRLAATGLLTPVASGTGLTKRYGVTPGSFAAVSASGWSLTLGGGHAYMPPADVKGAYVGHCEDLTAVSVPPADASLPRKDRIVARVDPATGQWEPVTISGTPGSGSPPPLPTNAVDLYETDVPANAGSLSLNNHIIDRRVPVVALGGITPSEAAPITGTPHDGMARWQGTPRSLGIYDASASTWREQSRADHVHGFTRWRALRGSDFNLGSGGDQDERVILEVFTSGVSVGDMLYITANWTGFTCTRDAGNNVTVLLRRSSGATVIERTQVYTRKTETDKDIDGGGSLAGVEIAVTANPYFRLCMQKRHIEWSTVLSHIGGIAATLAVVHLKTT